MFLEQEWQKAMKMKFLSKKRQNQSFYAKKPFLLKNEHF